MSKIVFFSIPAHGHTNPTLPVVSKLVNAGHDVWYYSFNEFQEKIEKAGATFISCDAYLPPIDQKELERKVGKDFAALIEMVADTTIRLDEKVCAELMGIQPDCIVYDSVCFWGKLIAKKLGIKAICSTTTFAFNKHTAKLMKRGVKEIFGMIFGMPRIKNKMQLLQSYGYEVENFVSLIQNDNETHTIVYTTKEFQPMVETFSKKVRFVGSSIVRGTGPCKENSGKGDKSVIYISLGTVLNPNNNFYQNCLQAFGDKEGYEVIMSVGEKTDLSSFGPFPGNFTVEKLVDQLAVLRKANVFITHCGMNSVNESLYYAVPMVLMPLHGEERMVANRVAELGAGIMLNKTKPKNLAESVEEVLENSYYRVNAQKLSESYQQSGGAVAAAEVIQEVINQKA
ncbi:glucosyltransferase [Mesobacillus maritimus]|uniref:macrolide family glycosyltransferase n=1 Tax=Mesobacillus maritimus TaxID=1643336 RepID=UPI00203B945A|nr:macrolide family glycosyltransferase [Mesobacillus maritimus]MCM3584633.1 glucosyltransferase [Mesobacillus maritimus]